MASGHGIHSLVGDVDAPVARVGAVAHRQEVDLVIAASAPQPRHLKNKKNRGLEVSHAILIILFSLFLSQSHLLASRSVNGF